MPERHLLIRCRPALLCMALLLCACGGEDGGSTPTVSHPLELTPSGVAVDATGDLASAPAGIAERIEAMTALAGKPGGAMVAVDYPLDDSVFPPEFIAPTFLWHDADPRADTWLIRIEFTTPGAAPITVLAPGAPPPRGEPDPAAFSETNEPWEGTEYQQSARSWTPEARVWEVIKQRSVEAPATLTFTGFASDDLGTALSRGSTRILTSKDPVGAPFFYRDVPLSPEKGETGVIKPLGAKFLTLIAWRLRDVSLPRSKLVLKGMASCGNCHSFSADGGTLAMDVDGPSGDKGMYAIAPIEERTVIDYEDTITWNSFPGRASDRKTIGFLSRISPDGRFVVSTVNEDVYVANFTDFRFLQVFYPTRGIFAYHSREEGGIRALPGADNPRYVHCSPAWTPDGRDLVFCRAPARDAYDDDLPMAKFAGDPNELPMRFDLYRMPFDGGKGGKPVPVEGASANGMSNTFPKVSPDGKWIVFVKCGNGLLMRPDSRLWIVPLEGGEAREMRCNTSRMNSWHSFSPNGRWLVFSSKSNTPYTQAFLTHIDEDGNDSPAILVPDCTAPNRAVNLPEFFNNSYDALEAIDVPAVRHFVHYRDGVRHLEAKDYEKALACFEKSLEANPTFAESLVSKGYVLWETDRRLEAVACFETAVASDPESGVALNNLGVALLDLGRPQLALGHIEKLVVVTSNYPKAQQALARAHADLIAVNEEIAEARRVMARDPDDPAVHDRLAGLYDRVGKPNDALWHRNRSVELRPGDAERISRLAWLLATHRDEKTRDGVRAVDLAGLAVELTGGREPGPLDAKAAALAEAGRFEEAVGIAEQARGLARESDPSLAAAIGWRLKLYRAGKPFRE